MKKNLKLVLAILLAAMMIVGSISAIAADGDGINATGKDTQIKVTGLETGDTVDFYQILEWKGEEGKFGGWSLTDTFKNFANDYADEAAAIKAITGDSGANPAVPMSLTAEIAGKLARLATDAAKKPGTVSGDTATLTIDGTTNTLGLYMALISPHDKNTLYNPVFVSADYNTTNGTESWTIATSEHTYSNNAAAKRSKVSLTKEDELGSGTYVGDPTWRSARPGETVKYTVKTTLPAYGPVFEEPKFKIKDQLTGLKMTASQQQAIKVEIDGTEVAAGNDTFTLTPSATGYEIVFKAAYLKGVDVPRNVVVSYEATIQEPESYESYNVSDNEVWIEYNHDTTDEDDFKYQKDDTEHYMFTIDADLMGGYSGQIPYSGYEIVKVGRDASGNIITSDYYYSGIVDGESFQGPLSGAKFRLYSDAKCENEYTKADGTKLGNDGIIVSEYDGRITIEGLDAGTYWLKEIEAPTGFIKDSTPVKFEIIPTYRTVDVTMYTDGIDWKDEPDATHTIPWTYQVEVLKSYTVKVNDSNESTYSFWNDGETREIEVSETETNHLVPTSIVNTKGVELPSTGGMGTTIFYVGGSILVLAAAILLVTKRRMGVED